MKKLIQVIALLVIFLCVFAARLDNRLFYYGTTTISTDASGNGTVTVTFPTAFTNAPDVLVVEPLYNIKGVYGVKNSEKLCLAKGKQPMGSISAFGDGGTGYTLITDDVTPGSWSWNDSLTMAMANDSLTMSSLTDNFLIITTDTFLWMSLDYDTLTLRDYSDTLNITLSGYRKYKTASLVGDNGDGKTKITSTAHGLDFGTVINIFDSDSAKINGYYPISQVATNSFVIDKKYTAVEYFFEYQVLPHDLDNGDYVHIYNSTNYNDSYYTVSSTTGSGTGTFEINETYVAETNTKCYWELVPAVSTTQAVLEVVNCDIKGGSVSIYWTAIEKR